MHEKCVNDGWFLNEWKSLDEWWMDGWLSNEWKLVDDLWMDVGWMSCIDMNVHSRMDDFHWYVITIHWIMPACKIKGEFTQRGDHISKLGPMIYPSGRTYCNPIHTYIPSSYQWLVTKHYLYSHIGVRWLNKLQITTVVPWQLFHVFLLNN
jgi:hypothetical protein